MGRIVPSFKADLVGHITKNLYWEGYHFTYTKVTDYLCRPERPLPLRTPRCSAFTRHGESFLPKWPVVALVLESVAASCMTPAILSVVDWLRSQLPVPVLTGLPFGHVPTKVLLPVGARLDLAVSGREAILFWD